MLRSTRRKRVVLALALATTLVALLMTAAGGSAGTTANSQKSAADTLIVLKDEIAPQMNPDGTNAANPGVWDVFRNVYYRLVSYPTKKVGDTLVPNYKVGQMGFVPQLAQSYTKKGLVWTFKLRSDIKSCAGNTLSADDVVYTFARAKSVSGGSPVAWFLSNVASILNLDPLTSKDPAAKDLKGEVVKIDANTVQITQMNENELFPRVTEIFALNIFDSIEMKKRATAKDPWSQGFTNNVGAAGYGPYCVTRWAKGSEVDFGWNANWAGKQAQFTKVVIRKVPQNANRVAAIKAGSADVVTTLTPTELKNVSGSKGVTVLGQYNTATSYIYLNAKIAPWSLPGNVKLRQAVAAAIPYDEIIRLDYNDTARRHYGFLPSTYNAYKPSLAGLKTDLTRAKALVAAAGYPGGKGLDKYKDGLAITYPAERQGILEPIVNRIRTNLNAIGMPITLNPISQAEFSDRYLTKKDIGMGLVDFGAPFGPDAGYAIQLFFVTSEKGGLNNGENYSNAKLDNLYFASQKSTGAARTASLAKQQAILAADLPWVPLYEYQTQIAVRTGISNWLITSDNSLSFAEFTRK